MTATQDPVLPRTYKEKWGNLAPIVTVEEFYKALPRDGTVTPEAMFDMLAPAVIGQSNVLKGKYLAVQNDVHPTGNLTMRKVVGEAQLLEIKESLGQKELTRNTHQRKMSEKIFCTPLSKETIRKWSRYLYDRQQKWNNNQPDPMTNCPVFDWLRASITWQADGQGTEYPYTELGDLDRSLPPLLWGWKMQRSIILNHLKKDLPGRFTTDSVRDTLLASTMKQIQQTSVEAAAAAQLREADRASTSEKTWENYSPFVKAKLSKLLKHEDEGQFPEAYLVDIRSKKSE